MKPSIRPANLHPARITGFFLLSAVLYLAPGCTSTVGPSKTNIGSEHQTFAVSVAAPGGTLYDRDTVARLAPVAVEAVTTVFTGKGYKEAPLESADLLVRLGGKFTPDIGVESSIMTGGMAPNLTKENAEHRVLLIDVLDNRTKKLLWADSYARGGTGTPLPADRLRSIINEMLGPFPNAIQPSGR